MKISFRFEDRKLTLLAEPDEADVEFFSARKVKLVRTTASFSLPEKFDQGSVHPDALALLAILVFGPYSSKTILLSWGVSAHFAETVQRSFRRRLWPVDPSVAPRHEKTHIRDALAFSGGVDSVAALCLLPADTLCIFMNRKVPDGIVGGPYKADAALACCRDVAAAGQSVEVVDTDMECVRSPIGFASDWTTAAGAVLLSDWHSLRSVSFGMIQESAFFIGHSHFSDLSMRTIYYAWAPLFEAIGLPISLPTSGLSEVMTSKIAATVSGRYRAQSCVRGLEDKPCGKCFKCFRKSILEARIQDAELPAAHFDVPIVSKEVRNRLLEVPIHHENVLAYSLNGLRCDPHPILEAVRQKTTPIFEYGKGLTCLEGFNPHGLTYVPDFLKSYVEARIRQHTRLVTAEERNVIETWDIKELPSSPVYVAAQKRLEDLLS